MNGAPVDFEPMNTIEESFCCDSEMVAEIRGDNDCVTQSEQFYSLIENCENLDYTRYLMSFQISDPKEKRQFLSTPMCNRFRRHIAYKTFVFMIHSKAVGKYTRIVLPACVVARVRFLYPEDEGGRYTGFQKTAESNVMSFENM